MNETIDVSQWLHQSFHKAYPHTMKALAVIEHNGKLTCSSRFTFDELYKQPEDPKKSPVFNSSHLSAAEFITALYDVAFRRTGFARFRDIIVDMCGVEGLSGYCPMTLYLITMRDLSPRHTHLIKRICFQELRTNDIGWIEQCSGSVRESFDELSKSIEKSLDTLREWLENGGITKPSLRPKFTPSSNS